MHSLKLWTVALLMQTPQILEASPFSLHASLPLTSLAVAQNLGSAGVEKTTIYSLVGLAGGGSWSLSRSLSAQIGGTCSWGRASSLLFASVEGTATWYFWGGARQEGFAPGASYVLDSSLTLGTVAGLSMGWTDISAYDASQGIAIFRGKRPQTKASTINALGGIALLIPTAAWRWQSRALLERSFGSDADSMALLRLRWELGIEWPL